MQGTETRNEHAVHALPAPGAESAAGSEYSYLDQTLWTRLNDAASEQEFAQSWLDLQCKMIGAAAGVVVLGPPAKGPFAPVAMWPQDSDASVKLAAVAEAAMEERRGVVRGWKRRSITDDGPAVALAYPLLVDGQLCGVVALALAGDARVDLRGAMRQLQWGLAWLEVLVRRKTFSSRDQLVAVLELVALCLEHQHFRAAATALSTELATNLSCERVSIGFRSGRHVRVEALSHSADFAKKSNFMRAIGAAMDEALDQREAVVYCHDGHHDEKRPQLDRAHRELARREGTASICTIPMVSDGRLLGAMTLERQTGDAFDADTVALCQRIASLVGPVLEAKRKEDRWLFTKIRHSAAEQLAHLFGAGHLGLKLGALLLLAVIVFLSVATGTYRVTADAALEGVVQRVVTAPVDAYVSEASVRAGDVVNEGDVMARLDDRDLRLERLKWVSQREQRLREYSKALAAHERAQVRVLGAQIDQAYAQIELLDQQLARTKLIAPFDGVVVNGDLSQSLGAPVERGEVLFEVAPLDGYRIILEVDERDVSQIAVGQRGQLALAGLPDQTLPMVVEKITPVSSTNEGRNYFRVEAMLSEPSALLRPGMEGIGKIEVDERLLAWIWSHKLVAWARMWFWSWWP
jgi:RND family efflux transporter MFP subunit